MHILDERSSEEFSVTVVEHCLLVCAELCFVTAQTTNMRVIQNICLSVFSQDVGTPMAQHATHGETDTIRKDGASLNSSENSPCHRRGFHECDRSEYELQEIDGQISNPARSDCRAIKPFASPLATARDA
jgi:hypothetical protein